MAPSIGRIVHYHLTDADAKSIMRRRAGANTDRGTTVQAGDTCPAMVVGGLDPATNSVSLKVFLDGTDELWAPDRPQSHEDEQAHGTWSWPVRLV